jgi:GH25 family lysozyme M1 (1,4-beta-N-acetylmuramidase)
MKKSKSIYRRFPGAIICAILLAFTLSACGSPSPSFSGDLSLSTPPYESPYDWEKLSSSNGRFSYSEQGERVSRTGIDVSSHQGSINWQAVSQDGIEFAFIRLGYRGYSEGGINLDAFFEENYLGATGVGIPVGVYFFSQAISEEEALAEARFVLDQLRGRTLQYPIVYDFEPVNVGAGGGRANEISDYQRTRNALTFCETIEAAGYPTMIYGNTADINSYYLNILGKRDIWFAEYDTPFPGGQFDFTIWQYTSTGQVAGIEPDVDLNIELVRGEQDSGEQESDEQSSNEHGLGTSPN